MMKIKDGFLIRDVAGQAVIIPDGKNNTDFKGMIKLNGTGKLIWESVANGEEEEAIALKLSEEYGITKEKALNDVQGFLCKMKEEGFIAE